jgi:crossover junction endodeoxyribonuclease RuvC
VGIAEEKGADASPLTHRSERGIRPLRFQISNNGCSHHRIANPIGHPNNDILVCVKHDRNDTVAWMIKNRKILGIDPGTLHTGYGIVAIDERRRFSVLDYGSISPPSSKPLTERYRIIFQAINTLLEEYAPEAVAVETQYIHKNPQSGIKLGMARGVAVLAAALREIPVFEYAPARAKRAVVGNGNASKAQVQGMVQILLSLPQPPQPEDAADALALAICHAQAFTYGMRL